MGTVFNASFCLLATLLGAALRACYAGGRPPFARPDEALPFFVAATMPPGVRRL